MVIAVIKSRFDDFRISILSERCLKPKNPAHRVRRSCSLVYTPGYSKVKGGERVWVRGLEASDSHNSRFVLTDIE
jgi:hypothetical protein